MLLLLCVSLLSDFPGVIPVKSIFYGYWSLFLVSLKSLALNLMIKWRFLFNTLKHQSPTFAEGSLCMLGWVPNSHHTVHDSVLNHFLTTQIQSQPEAEGLLGLSRACTFSEIRRTFSNFPTEHLILCFFLLHFHQPLASLTNCYFFRPP